MSLVRAIAYETSIPRGLVTKASPTQEIQLFPHRAANLPSEMKYAKPLTTISATPVTHTETSDFSSTGEANGKSSVQPTMKPKRDRVSARMGSDFTLIRGGRQ